MLEALVMKLVIFDCDGTIVDSQAGIVLSMDHAFKSLGLKPPSRAETLAVVGLSLPEAFSMLAPGAEYETKVELAERYKAAFRELNHDPSETEILYDGARATIEDLSSAEDIVLGIATGKSRRGVDRLFDREGWHKCFATIQTADDHPSKPNPSMILKAMAETGASKAETVMIGDTTYDIQMARAAGVGSIGVTWGYHDREELEEAEASLIIDTYDALPGAVWSLLKKGNGSA
jgi:phosphoglycolate phosphatase